MVSAADIPRLLAPHGLIPRGAVLFDASDDPLPGPTGRAARMAILIGHAGASHWRHFRAWQAGWPAGQDHPLDTWSREVLDGIAAQTGTRAVHPNDRPWLPFQRWAMRAEGLRPSPLGILIHPVYGLWHAWRGALLSEEALESVESLIQPHDNLIHPCEQCVEKPCLTTCPVNAFSVLGYDVPACAQHVDSASGTACRTAGCIARNACPVGADFRYPAEQQAFHMEAFLSARRDAGGEA